MHAEALREFVLQFPEVEEGLPFGETVLVFKTGGKIFLLLSLDSTPMQYNLKCDPDRAIELREQYPESILPGYHMNKKHWNTVIPGNAVPVSLQKEMIRDSYELVRPKQKHNSKG